MEKIINESQLENFIKQELECDVEFIANVLASFNEYISEFQNIGFDHDAESIDKICAMAHKLKSNCVSFGAENLQKALTELEQAGSDQNAELVDALYTYSKNLSTETTRCLQVLVSQILEQSSSQTA